MINWSEFEKLPSSQQHNFEMLCRSLIRLHYCRYGLFGALSNQPGVEFHLRLHTACTALGKSGDWFGWQCRWYDLPKATTLGSARRKHISDALMKTETVLPDLTDWVLWTRHTLTKSDQSWFASLKTKFRLHMWTSAEVETLLSGEAEILRRTYFGELILSAESLAQQHALSASKVGKRWMQHAHQPVEAERVIRRMLGEVASWDEIVLIVQRLLSVIAIIKREQRAFDGPLSTVTPPFIDIIQKIATTLEDVHRLLGDGDLEL